MKFTNRKILALAIVGALLSSTAFSAKKEAKDSLYADVIGGMKFRSLGPAWCSGRIADFAVNPDNPAEYYAGVASGNVWKTVNNGTTWQPVFDNYGAYAIGAVEMDPNNHNVIWVGTGENNHQRALGYGDGVYKSLDGGESFKNMGLKDSRQIGAIVIDPRNSDVVFVAAEGSAWGPGGDRGLYKTIDGGQNWEKVLEISENTGVNNVAMDPENPDVMYATSEQRRRHHYGKIGGGPESAVYKSTDGGQTWRKIMKGLPSVHIGGMGIAISPVDVNVVYLIVEAQDKKGGFFRSTNKGESWKRMSDYHSSGQYYNVIVCDPVDVDKVYSLETFTKLTLDGGKTWKNLGNNKRHVDDHAMWINPDNTAHILIGGDGGIYETYDGGKHYDFKENLPVTQFYRVNVDNDYPFYNVYGGTQDNNSFGGPSRNTSSAGITNDEWMTTLGGDGFWQAIDPEDPNIVYSEYQYGNMIRYDKRSGEKVFIKPRERKGEEAYKWNWNAPLILSPHANTTLYCAANKVFRSNDRGQSWEVISDDLTAQVDRNSLPMMDKYWSADAVVKHVSTSQWGTIVAMDESRVQEGLLYVGTDDGVISVTEDNGANWFQVEVFPDVPEYTYCSDIRADKFNENVVYATFDNRKRDDFKPYVLKSMDKGRNWTSIAASLPQNQTVHSIEQDFLKKELLFAGTELGIYFSVDAGENWDQLKAGIPTISVKDIAIQERESDLVLATFGRGFYVLDDYSPLRDLSPKLLEEKAHLFPVKDALKYIKTDSRGNQGSTYYFAKNPAYGATFTYYLKEAPKSTKAQRHEAEKDLFEKGEFIPQPTWRELQLESKEEKAHLIFTVRDSEGKAVRRIVQAPAKGINRVTWNLTYPSTSTISSQSFDPVKKTASGIRAMAGDYTVELAMWEKGEMSSLTEALPFIVKELDNRTFAAKDPQGVFDFDQKMAELYRQYSGTAGWIKETTQKLESMKQSLYALAEVPQDLMDELRELSVELELLNHKMYGVPAKASWEEIPPAQMPISQRIGGIQYTRYASSSDVTETEKTAYAIVEEELNDVIDALKTIKTEKLPSIEKQLDELGVGWTPGRIPSK